MSNKKEELVPLTYREEVVNRVDLLLKDKSVKAKKEMVENILLYELLNDKTK